MSVAAGLSCRLACALALAALAACSTQTQTTQRSAAADTTEGTPQPAESSARKRAEARLELAVGYYSRRQYQVALEELNTAAQADPGYSAIYNARGLIYMDLGDKGLAEDNFQRGLRLAPTDSETNNNYGWFLCQNGRAKESIAYFQAAIKNPLYSTPDVPLRNAGLCSALGGNLTDALDYLQRSFRINPSNAVTMYNLADVLFRTGELERAHFYSRRLNSEREPTAQTLWLQLRIDRQYGDRESEQLLAGRLRSRFPASREAGLLNRGVYDE
ncbi:type IV pilus biogenesis/stability protein PilW [soil metagenome]